jgi:hypothetical protein
MIGAQGIVKLTRDAFQILGYDMGFEAHPYNLDTIKRAEKVYTRGFSIDSRVVGKLDYLSLSGGVFDDLKDMVSNTFALIPTDIYYNVTCDVDDSLAAYVVRIYMCMNEPLDPRATPPVDPNPIVETSAGRCKYCGGRGLMWAKYKDGRFVLLEPTGMRHECKEYSDYLKYNKKSVMGYKIAYTDNTAPIKNREYTTIFEDKRNEKEPVGVVVKGKRKFNLSE